MEERHDGVVPRWLLAVGLTGVLLLASMALISTGGPVAADPTDCPVHEYLGNHPNEYQGSYSEEGQGMAHTDTHWFLTQKDALWKIPATSDLDSSGTPSGAERVKLSRDFSAPYDHFGDPDQYGGYIFIPLEGSAVKDAFGNVVVPAPPPLMAVYRASDLAFMGSAVLIINAAVARNAGWIAIRESEGKVLLYSSSSRVSVTEPVFVYELDMARIDAGETSESLEVQPPFFLDTENIPIVWQRRIYNPNSGQFEIIRTETQIDELTTMQGGTFTPYGDFYLASNQGVFLFAPDGSLIEASENRSTGGGFQFQFSPGFDKYEEPEGLDWWDLTDGGPATPGIEGQLHVMLLDNDVLTDDDVYLKHYEVDYGCRAAVDTDGDGINDFDEVGQYGTDPLDADTDGDGLPDGDEIEQYGTDPLDIDSDGDGLGDGFEVDSLGTDPLDTDSDGDGLDDGDEVKVHFTDPVRADTDGDGLDDGPEVNVYGTDPLVADTDGDGLDDGPEVNVYGTDPLVADTDGDGLDDGPEVNVYGTDPLVADTDGDGLDDGPEVNVYGTDPLVADTDGDGLDDGPEVNVYGTDPLDADSDGDGLDDGPEVNVYGTDPLDADSDDDGLEDGLEVSLGITDPLDEDSDDDGLLDGSDTEFIEAAVDRTPDTAWKVGVAGLRNATDQHLAAIEAATGPGSPDELQLLRNLRRRFDGCGDVADSNDWVSDCPTQLEIRALLDILAVNLS